MTKRTQLICDCAFHSDGNHGIIATTDTEPAACGNLAAWIVLRDSLVKTLDDKLSCDECLDDFFHNHRRQMPRVELRPVPVQDHTSRAEAIADARRQRQIHLLGSECWCFHGPPTKPGLSGHEFSPADETGEWTRPQCKNRGSWLGTWKCGGCPDIHSVQVCGDCRAAHDADAATGQGAVLAWELAPHARRTQT